MKKQNLFFILLMLVGISSCGIQKNRSHRTPATGLHRDSVFVLAVNDMHASLDRMPRLAFIVDSLRAIHPDLLVVSGGDNQTGNPINDVHNPKGWPMIRLMNEIGFNASAVGNHEFDSRPRGFEYLTQHADFAFINDNFTWPDSLDMKIQPWYPKTLSNGIKVGFVSLLQVSPRTGIPASHPNNVRGFHFTDPIECGPTLLHYADSCDVLMFVNHIGYTEDQKLAHVLTPDRVPLIIGGHSHTYVKDNDFHNGILVTQAEAKLSYASLITIVLDDKKVTSISSTHIAVGDKGTRSERVQKIVDEMNNAPYFNEVIATTPKKLKEKEEVGYLMTQALREMTGADIALVNGGGVRINHLNAGDIHVKDVFSMDPFGNEAMIFTMTGHDILALFESALVADSYLFVIPDGMHVRYTRDANHKIHKIELMTTANQPLDLDKSYKVAMNSYMPVSMSFPKNDQGKNLGVTTAELTINYLKKIKVLPPFETKRFILVTE